MSILAQSPQPGVGDNAVLDQWDVPFGAWITQMVSWIDQNLAPVLDVIEWPFTFLFRNFVNGPAHHPWWEIADMPWIAVCVAFLVIGMFTRNLRVGVSVALALALCGILGTEYWKETVITLGIIVVAVVLCAVIGIPLGILCGRFDGAWNVVRPVLDAMQVVHPFIYMLPIIFFFGIGAEPATMVTMVFALPPLIRLTNLGIRQVPADVVEASRAYGASEGRVLRDVQLPLARPAIMTGLNQTLLLSISMLGIAAIMASGGLGRPVFQAVQNLDTAQAASSGLALFIVAVVLDRISQSEASDGEYLLTRIRKAWRHRLNPEALLPTAATIGAVAATEAKSAPVDAAERRGATLALAGAVLGVVSVFMTWGSDSGLISGYGRFVDQDLAGRSFNGLGAEGGSVYGYAVLAFSLLAAQQRWYVAKPGWGARGSARRSPGVRPRRGLGRRLPLGDAPRRQCRLQRRHRSLAGAGRHGHRSRWSHVLVAVRPVRAPAPAGQNGGDGPDRGDHCSRCRRCDRRLLGLDLRRARGIGHNPRVGRGDRGAEAPGRRRSGREHRGDAEDDRAHQPGAAHREDHHRRVQFPRAAVRLPGSHRRRYGYGLLLLASALFGHDERRKWIWSAATAGASVGLIMIAFNWIGSLTRVADAKLVSGAGAFLCLMAGLTLLMTTRSVLGEFRRSEVYVEIDNGNATDPDPAGGAYLSAQAAD